MAGPVGVCTWTRRAYYRLVLMLNPGHLLSLVGKLLRSEGKQRYEDVLHAS